jgi:DNA-binding PadR family transcriptional regulator
MRAESLKGHLDGLVLAVLEPGPLHGYAVIDALRTGSGGLIKLRTGTIYPALHRLERAGLLHSHWTAEVGRRRRTYGLTAAGARALADSRASWPEIRAAVSALLLDRACAPTR